jgi:hypothetical protein
MAMSPEPTAESRQFFLGLPGRFQQILALCRPVLEQVYKDEKHEPPPPDIFSLFKLSGFCSSPRHSKNQAKGKRQASHASFERIARPHILSSPNQGRPQRCGIASECDRQTLYPLNSVLAYAGFWFRVSLSAWCGATRPGPARENGVQYDARGSSGLRSPQKMQGANQENLLPK